MRIAASALAAVLMAIFACGPPAADPPSPETRQPAPRTSPAVPPKIAMFYASPASVTSGEQVQICYGVENADSVSIEPHLRDLRPSYNRCFTYAPKQTQSYKLTAKNETGEVSQQFTIQVDRSTTLAKSRLALITTFVSSEEKVPPGGGVTLCYALNDVESVSIDPPVRKLEPTGHCFTVRMQKTTTFKLTAHGGGETDTSELTVTVE